MAIEIERKFLVNPLYIPQALNDAYKIDKIYQGYFHHDFGGRIRIINGEKSFLTIKIGAGLTKEEFEYEVPIRDGITLRHHCTYKLFKTRYSIIFENKKWELDVFHKDEYGTDLDGLVVAEIELSHEAEQFTRPDWLLEEVTYDNRFSNLNLAFKGIPEIGTLEERKNMAISVKDYVLAGKIRTIQKHGTSKTEVS